MAVCLMYHNVVETARDVERFPSAHREYVLTRGQFSEHMALVSRMGLSFLSPDDAAGEIARDNRSVLLTFDDSWDNSLAVRVMSEHAARGIFFINPAELSRLGMTGEKDLREAVEAGHEIGSHGMRHEFFTRLPAKALEESLLGSRERLEEITGRRVRFLSAPGGRYDRRVVELAIKTGYKALFVSRPGRFQGAGAGVFILNRLAITADTTLKSLARCLADPAPLVSWRGVRYGVLRLMRCIQEMCGGEGIAP